VGQYARPFVGRPSARSDSAGGGRMARLVLAAVAVAVLSLGRFSPAAAAPEAPAAVTSAVTSTAAAPAVAPAATAPVTPNPDTDADDEAERQVRRIIAGLLAVAVVLALVTVVYVVRTRPVAPALEPLEALRVPKRRRGRRRGRHAARGSRRRVVTEAPPGEASPGPGVPGPGAPEPGAPVRSANGSVPGPTPPAQPQARPASDEDPAPEVRPAGGARAPD